MKKTFFCAGISFLVVGLSNVNLVAKASVFKSSTDFSPNTQVLKLAQADESKLITENRELLLSNRELARKIATKLGITSSGEVPTSGTPLEQNQILIMQNQETFKAIATKVGATMPELSKPAGADVAEQNHNLLLQNRKIVVAIAEKIGVTLSPPAELSGSFVSKNHALLLGNKASLGKIAEKLGV
jgi:predicted trehalose synthase